MTCVDLNADLGEALGPWQSGDDEAMLQLVTSANVACGFHAGDATTMLTTCRVAATRGVVVGAHVSYQDLTGFGRHFVDLPPARLHAEVTYQLGALAGVCRAVGTTVAYVKPHGALYNAIVHHERQARAVVEAVAGCAPGIGVLGLPDSAVEQAAARAGIPFHVEVFADRGYRADGTLVPRGQPGDLLHDPDHVAARMVRLVRDGVVQAVDGSLVQVSADSVCVHGDTPGAVSIARAVREALTREGVTLAPFAG